MVPSNTEQAEQTLIQTAQQQLETTLVDFSGQLLAQQQQLLEQLGATVRMQLEQQWQQKLATQQQQLSSQLSAADGASALQQQLEQHNQQLQQQLESLQQQHLKHTQQLDKQLQQLSKQRQQTAPSDSLEI